MDDPVISLSSVLLGVVLTGGVDMLKRAYDRRLERNSVKQAISAEIATLCETIRRNGYVYILSTTRDQAQTVANSHPATPFQMSFNLVMTADYMEVYRANLSKVGLLDARDSHRVVRFYGGLKSLVDSLQPHSDALSLSHASAIAALLAELVELAEQILALGDEITGAPATKISTKTETGG